jgi:hypothetical protein
MALWWSVYEQGPSAYMVRKLADLAELRRQMGVDRHSEARIGTRKLGSTFGSWPNDYHGMSLAATFDR